MISFVFWAVVFMIVGAIFSESIRAIIRKISKGRFFGPVTAKDTLDLTHKVD